MGSILWPNTVPRSCPSSLLIRVQAGWSPALRDALGARQQPAGDEKVITGIGIPPQAVVGMVRTRCLGLGQPLTLGFGWKVTLESDRLAFELQTHHFLALWPQASTHTCEPQFPHLSCGNNCLEERFVCNLNKRVCIKHLGQC